jgi:hypothetical protein
MPLNTDDYVFVPIPATLYNELVLRRRSTKSVNAFIENSLSDFLDRTQADSGLWSDEYLDEILDEDEAERRALIGDPASGYRWQTVYLPNGTDLKITYKSQTKTAQIRHSQVWYDGKTTSPSQYAYLVANNTSRNAWRDIYVRFPNESDWTLADTLRRQNND